MNILYFLSVVLAIFVGVLCILYAKNVVFYQTITFLGEVVEKKVIVGKTYTLKAGMITVAILSFSWVAHVLHVLGMF